MIIGKNDKLDKKIDRIYINYSLLNDVIEKDSESLPNIKKYLSFFYEVKWLI